MQPCATINKIGTNWHTKDWILESKNFADFICKWSLVRLQTWEGKYVLVPVEGRLIGIVVLSGRIHFLIGLPEVEVVLLCLIWDIGFT